MDNGRAGPCIRAYADRGAEHCMQYSSGFPGCRRGSDASAHYLEAFVMRFEPEVLIDARWRFS